MRLARRPVEVAAVALSLAAAGCGGVPVLPVDDRFTAPIDPERYELLVRFAHISDVHVVDEESPGRLTAFAGLSKSFWRPQEAYSIQVLDGTVRAVNRIHATRNRIDFLIHTGDGCDNSQHNELGWLITAIDGGEIDPLSGMDDREPTERPAAELDPHAKFVAQGLYRQGVHGDGPTIQWYNVFGNHDRFGLGVFPIIEDAFGVLIAPLPLQNRVGLFAPRNLDPTGKLSWSIISPAHPGPAFDLPIPRRVTPNPDRRFFTAREFVEAHLASSGEPRGHGFNADNPSQTWYSVSPKPGLRLIALNSSTPLYQLPTLAYADGAISAEQRDFLIDELEKAQADDEVVIVATHHPSAFLQPVLGTSLTPSMFRSLLNDYSCVKLHIAGHMHVNAVFDRGGYIELVTGSIIDFPQQGRIVELWRARGSDEPGANPDEDGATGDLDVQLRLSSFSYYEEIHQPTKKYAELFADALAGLRRVAAELAGIILPDNDTD